jgi:hypothetical protein
MILSVNKTLLIQKNVFDKYKLYGPTNPHSLQTYFLPTALQELHLTIVVFPHFGQLNITKLSFALISILQLVHLIFLYSFYFLNNFIQPL